MKNTFSPAFSFSSHLINQFPSIELILTLRHGQSSFLDRINSPFPFRCAEIAGDVAAEAPNQSSPLPPISVSTEPPSDNTETLSSLTLAVSPPPLRRWKSACYSSASVRAHSAITASTDVRSSTFVDSL